MGGEIRRIDSIKGMAVFGDFQWAASVRDNGNNIGEFKKINIVYGRNYSGKTTLSRIFRALETESISEKYNSPEFRVSFDDGTSVTQDSLDSHGQTIRVFNEDFVRDNLRFIVDEEQDINSFAILGEDNAKLEKEIERHEAELGTEAEKTGLLGKYLEAKKKSAETEEAYKKRTSELERKLTEKANNREIGIKHNKFFGDATYNINKIKADIETVTDAKYLPLANDRVEELFDLLKEESKPEIPESSAFDLQSSILASKAKALIEKKILISNPIQELLNDATLATWVRDGRKIHHGKREKCGFCGNNLPSDLWEKLDKHFNQESEDLRGELVDLLKSIEAEQSRAHKLLTIKNSAFYSKFGKELDSLAGQLALQTASYCASLDFIREQAEKRRGDIFNPLEFMAPVSVEDSLNAIRESYEQIRTESNLFTAAQDKIQAEARIALRLYEIHKFICDINYEDEWVEINNLKGALDEELLTTTAAKLEADAKRETISDLKAKLKDESKGADRVNAYLNNFFGHQYLSLKAIEEECDDASSGYRFEITRNGVKAFHLSEGECSLIAFCYFMARLHDIETEGNQPIIWIDDPISSLDANHIFFVYSLIYAEIVASEKYEDDGEVKERERFKQLFISTHNLDFLKYLKRLPGALNDNKSQYFIITRSNQFSDLTLMPRYLKDYVTEFNFLFKQIYKCAVAKNVNDENHDCFYNFGNNARKFLDALLYYKYPNGLKLSDKLAQFFEDDVIAASLTDRIDNEFSHLEGLFERSVLPVDVPEMKRAAQFILAKMKENDHAQYSALLQSIGVTEEPSLDVMEA